ncbi:MAG: chromosomal replication initiator protein DnaA [Clostridia bacterium]|nr:chromosomal replication initiator protein DnaA [Clostridia bacterium]
MSVLREVERAVLSVIREQYSDVVFDLWFKDLHLIELSEKEAVFSISSAFKQNIIQSRHAAALKEALRSVNGFDVEVRITCAEEPDRDPKEDEAPARPEPPAPAVREEPSEVGRAIENRSIVSEYTFENFIVGDSNKFAHAACYAVAKSPTTYNPLFIHGPSGLGKTHLLYAVTNEMKRNNPNIRLIYKKCEEFTNELIESIQKGTTIAFKEKYRSADVLLIDDIQFIAGKVAVQEEFFHTFNILYEAEKQIILTSDRPPRDIRPLEERLMTRFEWGLIADIQPPSLELRCAIIQKKAEQRGITLAPEIVNFLAENLRVNIRQIEGSIKKIAAISMLTGTPVSLDMTKRAISDILSGTEPVSVTVDRIFDAVSKKYGVPVEDIKGNKRNKSIAQARHVAVYIIRRETSLPVTAIGDILNRDHATVLASVNKIKNDMRLDPRLADEIEEIASQIKQ